MKLTRLFIERPRMATLVMLGILFLGTLAYRAMPVSYLPAVEFPTIQVSASLSGASAETMASNVATPLEQQFTDIQGLKSMSSSSNLGQTSITLQFELDRKIDFAAMDVQAAISKAQGDLPTLDAPPSFSKVNPTDQPVLWINLTSDTMRMSDVYDNAKTLLIDNISMVEGVGEVEIYGSTKFAVRIQIDPEKIAALGIGIDEVASAVEAASVDLPLGQVKGPAVAPLLDSNGQLYAAAEYGEVVVAYRNSQPIYLKDLGRVTDGILDDNVKVRLGEKEAITLAIKKQIGANTIAVVKRFYERYDTIKKQMPAGIDMGVFYDQSIPVKASIDDVKFTLCLAVILVVLVVFFFLRNLAATFIAALAIPLSLIATFGAMLKLGFTLDMLSLMALTLAIGFVVDDAIVIIENVVRHMHMGKSREVAAREGSDEIGFTILSMTLALVVVFIPILFMSGVIGKVLHEFAMTISATVLVSGLVSLTLTPMLCTRLLGKKSAIAESDPVFGAMQRFYKWSLDLALRLKWLTVLIGLGMLAGTLGVLSIIPKGFEPQDDLGFLQAFAMGREGVSPERIAKQAEDLLPLIKQNPNVEKVLIVSGYPAANNVFLGILLKPFGKGRDTPASEVAQQLGAQLNVTPGLWVFITNPPMIPLGGKQTKSQYQYTLQSTSMDDLVQYGTELTNKLRGVKEITGVTSDLSASTPQVEVEIDRDKADALGLTASGIETAMLSAYAERRIVTIYGTNDTYKVILELSPGDRRYSDQLGLLHVRNSNGDLVRLDSFCSFKDTNGFLTVNHTGQLPSVTISYNTAPGVSLSEANKAVSKIAGNVLPDSITAGFEGMSNEFEAAVISLGKLMMLCVLVIYIILGILYEDYFHPLTILSGLPSAAFGGLLILMLFGRELDLFGFVGLILLVGIVMKNAIMVVNFALQKQHAGQGAREAVYEGALIRFRPIMMTTFAAIMGALPIALGIGAGAQARQPMGLIIVGGLLLSQLVTLYLTPVVYIYLDSIAKRFEAPSQEPAEESPNAE